MNAVSHVRRDHETERKLQSSALRLALFSGNYNYHMDGPVRALNRLVGYLERRGAAVMVFAPTSPTPACAPTGTLVSIPSIPVPGRPEYRLGLGLPGAIRRQIAAFRPTLFHISAPDWSGYSALKLAQRSRIPAVASFHTRFDTYLGFYGAARLQNAVTGYLRHFYSQCRQLYAPSESMAAVLRDQHMCRDVRIWGRGIDCGTFNPAKRDLAWRRSLGIADQEVVILFVGRVVMEKGLDAFAAAVSALAENGISHRVLLVGDGPALPWLRARLPHAIAPGFLRDDQLSRAYASSDIFLNPSVTETFGNVTAEAMASGLPAVCADATGSRSLVDDGATGFLVPGGRTEAYVAALRRLALNPTLRAAFGAAAHAKAQTLSWDAVLDGLFDDYLDALSGAVNVAEAGNFMREPVLQQSPI